jgi:hypothetical protein
MILKRTWFALLLAALFLGTAAALKYSQSIGLIDAETVKRTVQVMCGLLLAAYSNFMPKDLGHWPASAAAVARAQSALRVGGWSLTLAGLTYAGLWAFAPLPFANLASLVIVASATLITMTYAGWTLMACRAKHARVGR